VTWRFTRFTFDFNLALLQCCSEMESIFFANRSLLETVKKPRPKRFGRSLPRKTLDVDLRTVDELPLKFADYRRTYTEDSLAITEFDSFAPTRRTLCHFIATCHEIRAMIHDRMFSNPDLK
jgi:hypothetical protein